MLKRYIKDIVKAELTKQKLNNIYGSSRLYNLNSVSDKERQELNEEISILKNHNNNIIERNKHLKLKIYQIRQENEILKQENEKLEKSIKNLGGTLSLKDNLLNEKNKEIEELNYLYEKEKNKNYKTLESLELKQENEKLRKELRDSKNGLNGANDIIKNMKQENQKLKNILTEIYEITDSTWVVKLPYFEVRSLLNKIREISKIG